MIGENTEQFFQTIKPVQTTITPPTISPTQTIKQDQPTTAPTTSTPVPTISPTQTIKQVQTTTAPTTSPTQTIKQDQITTPTSTVKPNSGFANNLFNSCVVKNQVLQ